MAPAYCAPRSVYWCLSYWTPRSNLSVGMPIDLICWGWAMSWMLHWPAMTTAGCTVRMRGRLKTLSGSTILRPTVWVFWHPPITSTSKCVSITRAQATSVVSAVSSAEFRPMRSRRRASAPRRPDARPCGSSLARGRTARQSVAGECRRTSMGWIQGDRYGQTGAARHWLPVFAIEGRVRVSPDGGQRVALVGQVRGERFGPANRLRVNESLPAGGQPTLHWRNYLTPRSDE